MQQHGSLEFYRKNVEVLRQMLESHRTGCVIECGMGSLSGAAQKALYEYCETNPVIYITRESHVSSHSMPTATQSLTMSRE